MLNVHDTYTIHSISYRVKSSVHRHIEHNKGLAIKLMEEFSESFSHKFKPEQIYTNTQSQMIRHTFVKIQTDLF